MSTTSLLPAPLPLSSIRYLLSYLLSPLRCPLSAVSSLILSCALLSSLISPLSSSPLLFSPHPHPLLQVSSLSRISSSPPPPLLLPSSSPPPPLFHPDVARLTSTVDDVTDVRDSGCGGVLVLHTIVCACTLGMDPTNASRFNVGRVVVSLILLPGGAHVYGEARALIHAAGDNQVGRRRPEAGVRRRAVVRRHCTVGKDARDGADRKATHRARDTARCGFNRRG